MRTSASTTGQQITPLSIVLGVRAQALNSISRSWS
jgi:hypothetical protein